MAGSSAGYSGRTLVQKLGLAPGMRVALLNEPDRYRAATLGELPDDVQLRTTLRGGDFDMVHLFTTSRAQLQRRFEPCKAAIHPAGMFWVSWPKRAAKVPTDMTEDVVREIALPGGLVDTKVCAVDETWSALKLVYRLADRPGVR